MGESKRKVNRKAATPGKGAVPALALSIQDNGHHKDELPRRNGSMLKDDLQTLRGKGEFKDGVSSGGCRK